MRRGVYMGGGGTTMDEEDTDCMTQRMEETWLARNLDYY